jgi:hypothetical protein
MRSDLRFYLFSCQLLTSFKPCPYIGASGQNPPRLEKDMSNRETWLAAFATAAKPYLAERIGGLGGNEEAVVRLSCGFPPKTGRKAADAAIVPPAASDDFTAEVFVSPTVDNAQAVAALVLPLLEVALKGNWRSASPKVAAPVALPSWANSILANLGEYPHAKIELVAAPKQTTRLIKVACLNDGYIARVSRTTLENLGAPICPACNQSLVEA